MAAQATPLASTIGAETLARKLRQVGHALGRRLDIWQRIVRMDQPAPASTEVAKVDPERLSLCLAEIDALTGNTAEGQAWRSYLLVDALREWSHRRPLPDERLPRMLAERALRRLTRIPMTASQRRFVSGGPLATLRTELQRRTAEPVDPARLLDHLERYEQSGWVSDAHLLARDCLNLGFSSSDERRQLADRLQTHYRNANIRVAVTEELLNRLMQEREPEYAQVRDQVLGVPVYGRSLTSTDVGLRLVPDASRARIAL